MAWRFRGTHGTGSSDVDENDRAETTRKHEKLGKINHGVIGGRRSDPENPLRKSFSQSPWETMNDQTPDQTRPDQIGKPQESSLAPGWAAIEAR